VVYSVPNKLGFDIRKIQWTCWSVTCEYKWQSEVSWINHKRI